MSTVSVTNITEGAVTSIADVNATNTSWNAATAAGTITIENFREEGLDRRSLASHSVYTQRIGTSFNYTNTGSHTYTGAVAVVTLGGTDVKVGPIEVTGDDYLIIRVSAFLETLNPTADAQVILQSSTDNAVWSSITVTARNFKTTASYQVGATPIFPSCSQSVTITHAWTTTGSTLYFRLALASTGASTTVRAATMLVQLVAV